MRIAVIGGTGRTGRHVVGEATVFGHDVRLLSRRADHAPPGAEVIVGEATSADDLARLCEGADAIINALGFDGGLDEPQDLRTRTARALVDALAQLGAPARVVGVASINVLDAPNGGGLRGESGDPAYRNVFLDHRGHFEALRDSGLDWTLACPPLIPEGAASGTGVFAVDDMPADGSGEIGTGELARLVLDFAVDPNAPRGRVGVAERARH